VTPRGEIGCPSCPSRFFSILLGRNDPKFPRSAKLDYNFDTE
jgi:hypothetical protein